MRILTGQEAAQLGYPAGPGGEWETFARNLNDGDPIQIASPAHSLDPLKYAPEHRTYTRDGEVVAETTTVSVNPHSLLIGPVGTSKDGHPQRG